MRSDFTKHRIIPVWHPVDGWSEMEIEVAEGGPPGMTLNEVIGHNLRSLREREGMSQRAFADLLNRISHPGKWSAAKLSQWENGERRFKVDDIYLLASLFGERVLVFMRPPTRLLKPRVGTISVSNYMAVRADVFEADFVFDPEHSTGDWIDPEDREGDAREPMNWNRKQGLTRLHQALIDQGIDDRKGTP